MANIDDSLDALNSAITQINETTEHSENAKIAAQTGLEHATAAGDAASIAKHNDLIKAIDNLTEQTAVSLEHANTAVELAQAIKNET